MLLGLSNKYHIQYKLITYIFNIEIQLINPI